MKKNQRLLETIIEQTSQNNKSVIISLVPDDNKQYHVDMLINDSVVRQEDINSSELKDYMQEKLDDYSLKQSRIAIKLFNIKKIKLHLKE